MEDQDGDGDDSTPFWLQNTTDNRLRGRVSSFFFSSGLVVFLLLVTALFFLVFIVPTTLSLSSHIFKPNSIKKSWDSFNILLVLVAVVFGFLSRNKNDDTPSYLNQDEFRQSSPIVAKNIEQHKSSPSNATTTTTQWYNYEDSNYYLNNNKYPPKDSGLRRNSNSYPDLRDFSSVYGDYQRRSYDDIQVHEARVSRVSDPKQLVHRRHRSLEQVEHLKPPTQTKTVIVDTLLTKSKEASDPPIPVPTETPPHAPPPPPAQPHAPHESVIPRRKKERSNRKQISDPISTPPAPERKRGGNATKEFINSLYNNKSKKKQRQKIIENLPPPSPPPSRLQNIFSTKKQKRTIKVTLKPQTAPQKPPKPINIEEYSISGGESPLNRIPPPPPPPPAAYFKTPAWRFVVQGDYVRVNSSKSDSPEETDSDVTPSAADGGDATAFYCPSPDVDTKAESFISSFRAKLKLEKNYSIGNRDLGLSGLGPGPSRS